MNPIYTPPLTAAERQAAEDHAASVELIKAELVDKRVVVEGRAEQAEVDRLAALNLMTRAQRDAAELVVKHQRERAARDATVAKIADNMPTGVVDLAERQRREAAARESQIEKVKAELRGEPVVVEYSQHGGEVKLVVLPPSHRTVTYSQGG